MRTRAESPWLLLGVVAAGVVAGALLDPVHGPRRRKWASKQVGKLGDAASEAVESLTDSVSSLKDSAASRTSSMAESVSSTFSSAKDSVSESARSLSDTLLSSLAAAAHAPANLLHRRTTLEKLRDTLSDAVDGSTSGFEKLQKRVSNVDWDDVQDAVKGKRPTMTAPLIGGGMALLLLGGAASLLVYSEGAADRRKRVMSRLDRTLGDVGDLAQAAGQRFSTFVGNDPVTTAPGGPIAMLDQIRRNVGQVATERSDVHVLLKEDHVILQGTAAPEEYDAIVNEVKAIAPNFTNDLQAVSV